MFLPIDIFEGLGTPFTSKDLMRHKKYSVKKRVWAAICASEVLAPESTATVAPFRAWRGSQSIAAKVPTQITNTLYVCHKP